MPAAVVLTAFLVGSSAYGEEDEKDAKLWLRDFAKAKEQAKAEKKDILMEFTGSDWCPPCISLHKNVLSKEEWAKRTPEHFILLKLDSPRDKTKVTEAEQKQYRELSTRYGVRGVPTIILADHEGKPYAVKVGYGGTEAKAYIDSLVEKVAVRKERDEAFELAKTTKGIDKAKWLAKGLDGIDAELAIKEYRDEVEVIIKEDVDNQAGLKDKYANLLKLEDIKKQLTAIQGKARGGKTEDAVKEIEELVSKEKLSGIPLQETLFVKAQILYGSDKPAAKKALEAAVEAAPKTDRAESIRSVLSRVFKDEEKPKEEPKKDEEKPRP